MSLSTDLDGIFKEWYTDKPVGDAFWRNSPVLKMIQKTEIGGDKYIVPVILGNGGAAAGDLTVANSIATANGAGNNQQFAVTPGQLFATFTILTQDILATRQLRGAFVPVPVLRMFQGLDAFRKLAATALYGTGFGEVGQVAPTGYGITPGAITQSATNTITVPANYMYKLSVGSQIVFTNGATPASTLRNVTSTITKIGTPGGTPLYPTVVLTMSSGAGTTFTPNATDWIELAGSRSGSATPLLPVGLPGWLPFSRGSLGTPFYGVDRSVNEIGGAGNFVQRSGVGPERYVDVTVRAVQAVRASGGEPDMLICSPLTYSQIVIEMNAQATLFQSINTGDKKSSNEVVKGISEMRWAFSSSWVGVTIDDPQCPDNYGWIIENDTLEFAGLTNTQTPLSDGVTGNSPGKQDVGQISSPDLSYQYIKDNYLTINDGPDQANGTTVKVTINMFGNFAVHNPSKCCVIQYN